MSKLSPPEETGHLQYYRLLPPKPAVGFVTEFKITRVSDLNNNLNQITPYKTFREQDIYQLRLRVVGVSG
jgi:hypothetical protein